MKYQIWIGGSNHMSGGIRALHVLKDELTARGHEAWMTYERVNDPDAVTVYPEIVSDNPEGSEKFCRWLLNTAVLPDECWGWEAGLGAERLLTVNIIELDLWRDRGLRRSGTAFWVGKGVRDDALIPEGAVEISRSNFGDRSALAEFVSGLDLLISFDPFTAVTIEAVVSGTPVFIPVVDERSMAHGWLTHGVAWGAGNVGVARDTVGEARAHYESLLPVFARRVDGFVEETVRLFG